LERPRVLAIAGVRQGPKSQEAPREPSITLLPSRDRHRSGFGDHDAPVRVITLHGMS
jgi:hypothetical protein